MQSRLANGLLAVTVSVFASVSLLGSSPLLAAEKSTPKSSPSPPTVMHALKHDTSGPLRLAHPPTKPFTGAGHEAARNEGPRLRGTEHKGVDPVVQRHFGSSQPTPMLNFDGGTAAEMGPFFGFEVAPPDTEGAVGSTQYFQFVNSVFHIYDKTTGNNLVGPLPGTAIFEGFGGFCENEDVTDPVVKYDHIANRWLATYLAFDIFVQNEFHMCLAVSTTDDATGSYNRYDFPYAFDIPDYPKFGVWPDAYYMTTDQFPGGSFSNSRVTAFDRNAMLAGTDATSIAFDMDPNQFAPLPGDLDGLTPPPAGAPNPVVATAHPNWDGNPTPGLHFWYFHVDFETPGNSTFVGPYDTTTPDFNPVMCGFSRNCIPQLNGEGLDAISGRTMFRAAYRNFGDHEAMTIAQTVNVAESGDQAGVRWTEVRDIFAPISTVHIGQGGNPAGPSLFQSGTYSPDSMNRWMPAIAMDNNGNMALGYSISDATIDPAIGITGRFAADPAGTMGDEDVMFSGTGSQQNTFNRWGDYSDVEIDPIDGCTFWYTNQYYSADGSFDWRTRIGSFQFPGCGSAAGTLEGDVVDTSKNPIENATVTANSFSTSTDAAGHYHFTLPVGTYDMTASKFGYTPDSASGVEVTDGGDTIQNFTLTPNLNLVVNGVVKDGSGAGWPLYARIDITGPEGFPGATLYTDPKLGYYSITLAAGFTYHFVVTSQIPGYNVLSQDVNVPVPVLQLPDDPPGFVANFSLTVDAGVCTAPGYTPGPPTPLMSESFDGGTLPPGWSVVDNTGSGGWGIVNDFAPCNELPPGTNPTGGSGAFALINSDCAGFVSLDTELRTASIDVSAFGGAIIAFNQDYFNLGDTADVDVSTDGGTTWNNALRQTASDRGPTSISAVLPNTGGQANVTVRFHYYNAFFAWWWAVDDIVVSGATCLPGAGGLVVGTVSDANNGSGLNGATVKNMPDGDSTTTHAVPDDPNVGDGFYALSAGSGPQPFEASKKGYQSAQLNIPVIPNSTVRLDFSLAAGWLSADPSVMNSKILPGTTDTQTLNITNAGSADGTFEILEGKGPLTLKHGPFASLNDRRTAQKRIPADKINAKTAKNLPANPHPPKRGYHFPQGGAGTVISSFPTNLGIGWGVSFDTSRVWISNPSYIGPGDDQNHAFAEDGTATGDTIAIGGAGLWMGDEAYDTATGMLWGVNVGGDDCISEMDPNNLVLTGNEICGSPWTNISQRGLA
ncbi:MAG TPA: carboxypeptidase regulatory-like domain-containing protein, partial [Thermomicrobiales bacterium]